VTLTILIFAVLKRIYLVFLVTFIGLELQEAVLPSLHCNGNPEQNGF
jgi:hypothetical protein